jgi:hypothetical protein
MKKDSQSLLVDIVQPIIKGIIKSYALEFIKPGNGGLNVIKE